ncbi:guanyl-nucleotide exchange factor Vps902 [Schizosaccharomyces cryophilus OY26]|uniref:Guanyl-nucleotide exchange factor Vps902 n=1 Tax=Schizosaccharomyces cryophilus (strain OY26 / ATCC MYA-4695 / CBS 11777 / NBRC 106824 / NRRL Y48691) TaxID=653667 RepID=S9X3E9_SCHCR|nr:guanyl-nucleotide exchange factor Vps902 [Schizosaccharomyces cryophilus OY26]EPY51632.1 guanyl-nucleotide exchange factor Vps902 [Schizosaccharomyces cryophilus OY26]
MSFLNSWRASKYTVKQKLDDIELPESASVLPVTVQFCIKEFISSLVSPVHPQLLSPDEITKTFHDFYRKTDEFMLSTLIPNPESPSQDVPLLSPEEMETQKMAKQHLVKQKDEWMNIIEGIVCEYLYDRLFCLSTSTDENKDDLLKKFASSEEKNGLVECLSIEAEIKKRLENVAETFFALSRLKTPLLKLNLFMNVSEKIVEASNLPKQELNADNLLNLTIFCILSFQGLQLVSHLNFVLRFRNPDYLTGQQKYCLTTFEAAISFILRACPNLLTHCPMQATDDPLSLEASAKDEFPSSDSNQADLETNNEQRSSLSNLRGLGVALEKSYSSFVNKVAGHALRNSTLSTDNVVSVNDPPLERFLTVTDASELKVGEINILLADYKRLARLIFDKQVESST